MNKAFPLYRKYAHNKTFYKIIDLETFDQLEILGKKYALYHFKVKVHPDRIYIQDLINNDHEHWLPIEEAEYVERLNYCEKNLIELH